jgi:hypothetical protein
VLRFVLKIFEGLKKGIELGLKTVIVLRVVL